VSTISESLRPDPARVAALLRRRLALLDRERRLHCALIRGLGAYRDRLMVENMIAGQVAGQLRRDAQQQEYNAELVRRQRCLAGKKPQRFKEAA